MRLRFWLAALFISFSTPALCQGAIGYFNTGNHLYENCKRTSKDYCVGYISGAYDMTRLYQADGADRIICPPKGVTNGQVRDVVLRDLELSPATRHEPAAVLVIRALKKAFPCPD